jgi:hypothetical protein
MAKFFFSNFFFSKRSFDRFRLFSAGASTYRPAVSDSGLTFEKKLLRTSCNHYFVMVLILLLTVVLHVTMSHLMRHLYLRMIVRSLVNSIPGLEFTKLVTKNFRLKATQRCLSLKKLASTTMKIKDEAAMIVRGS